MSYIKLDRKMLDWGWIGDPSVVALWIHILLSANYKKRMWQGIEINEGEMPTSVSKLAIETGLSVQQTRTALKKLESTNEITCKTTNKYTLIHVNKWCKYQTNNNEETSQSTSGATRQLTTPKEVKEVKNINNPSIVPPRRMQKPTIEDVRSYCQERHNDVDPERFWNYYEANGWRVGKNPMKDWKACVRTWERNVTAKAGRNDIVPTYDETVNTDFDEDRFNEIMKQRETK